MRAETLVSIRMHAVTLVLFSQQCNYSGCHLKKATHGCFRAEIRKYKVYIEKGNSVCCPCFCGESCSCAFFIQRRHIWQHQKSKRHLTTPVKSRDTNLGTKVHGSRHGTGSIWISQNLGLRNISLDILESWDVEPSRNHHSRFQRLAALGAAPLGLRLTIVILTCHGGARICLGLGLSLWLFLGHRFLQIFLPCCALLQRDFQICLIEG